MSYRRYQGNRSYRRFGGDPTYRPWVFANYGQPQRRRGYVSPVVFQTGSPVPVHQRLGAVDEDEQKIRQEAIQIESLKLQREMRTLSYVGLALSALMAVAVVTRRGGGRQLQQNKRRRNRRRKGTR